MKYMTRTDWGARQPKWNPGVVNPSLGVFMHYNGPPVSGAVLAGDYQAMVSFLQGIQRYHMDNNGWPDVAYSFCVDSVGRVWTLRDWGTAQAATMDWNWKSHSLFLPLGGEQAPSAPQIESCRAVIAEHNRRYGVGFVKGHQQAPNSTSCPGPKVLALVNSGAFNPGASAPTVKPTAPTSVPQPNGVDLKMNKPTMMQEPGGTVWIYYGGTPWRVHVKTPADVNVFKYLGVEYKVIDQTQANFFRRYSQEVKCG
jgi:hypothetical protein